MSSVSVIIPAYNSERTIARAIESALAQTIPPLEIIVVDDGSSDRTAEAVSDFGSAARLLKKPNGGPASARNLGARHASGNWLAMLDADDWWYPHKLEAQLKCDISDDIAIIHSPSDDAPGALPEELTFEALWRRNLIFNSSVLIRRSVFEELGGFDESRPLISVEDYNLWLRVAASGRRIVSCPEVLCHYTRGVGISSNAERFFAASLFNLELLARHLRLPHEIVQQKKWAILEQFGQSALFERNLELSRRLLREVVLARPSINIAIRLAASYAPKPVLDARRGVASVLSGDHRNEEAGTLFGSSVAPVDFSNTSPYLLVVIDTEEEFDWSLVPYGGSNVRSMAHQEKAQRIFERFRIVPSYAVDYAVASQEDGYRPLLEFLADGSCEIAAQLHPWLNPPISEELSEHNSFPGNLPAGLEAAKIRVLTETISANLGCRPILYRAGRYGLGPHTAEALDLLGYRIDCSVRPLFEVKNPGEPDFFLAPPKPFWFGPENRILEIPVTVGLTGPLGRGGAGLYRRVRGPEAQRFRIPGVLARTRLLDRVQLTPEGTSLAEAKRLTRDLRERDNHKVFVVSYHSPSLQPGNTPYVRSGRDLGRLLYWIEAYLEFFLGEFGGLASTPRAVLRLARGITAAQRMGRAVSTVVETV
ncbi:MAG: glycosyltransferase [Acetobacteraceae bacterium]|nr:glycosyltransferase [Acetobacteraceae bacterium]MBV8522537.1 glycosyltransferase [Acetobacteraceae bacterium]MBV8589355.1 glycosyltransferase [Acetobacteraceae bacterium]